MGRSNRANAELGCASAARKLLFAAAIVMVGGIGQAQGSDAKAVLRAMSDYVSSQQTIEFTFDSDIEIITPQLEKIQFTSSGDALLRRPDKLRAHRVGPARPGWVLRLPLA